jgi:hypothetical protein
MAIYEFHNNRPSKKQVIGCALNALQQGDTLAEIYWGENSLTLENIEGSWHGWGWIKTLGGSDIAQQLNSPPANR